LVFLDDVGEEVAADKVLLLCIAVSAVGFVHEDSFAGATPADDELELIVDY
jgi:hypothetical protein